MRSKKSLLLAFLLALGFSLPAFSAVSPLVGSEFGTKGSKITTRVTTFSINEPAITDDEEETDESEEPITTPVPKRTLGAAPLTHDQCKLTQNQQHVLYKEKITIGEGEVEGLPAGEYFCTCPYFFDNINDAQEFCDSHKYYEKVKDDKGNDVPVNGVIPKSDPIPCYYQREDVCTNDSQKPWAITYFGCGCEGYFTAKEFCEKKMNTSYKSDESLYQCEKNMDANTDYACHTKMDRSGILRPEYGDELKYESFSCKFDMNNNMAYFSKDAYWDYCKAGAQCSNELPDDTIEGKNEYINHYVGEGYPCIADAGNQGVSGYKYKKFVRKCYHGGTNAIKEQVSSCQVSGYDEVYNECYDSTSAEPNIYNVLQHQCACPENFKQNCEHPSYEIPGGTLCPYDTDAIGASIRKYSECKIRCGHDYAVAYASESSGGCGNRLIDGEAGGIRLKNGEQEECFLAEDVSIDNVFICACPTGWKTIKEWCLENYEKEGLKSKEECETTYKGKGTPCYRDVTRDESGEPNGILTKYATYIRSCPSDRPLYYSKEDCEYVGGTLDYYCHDGGLNTRVVCKCPESYYNEDGERNSGGDSCTVQSLAVVSSRDNNGDTVPEAIYSDAERYISPDGVIHKWSGASYVEKALAAESTGNYCSLSSENDLRYEYCTVNCSALLEEFSKEGAYIYLSSEKTTPTPLKCQNQLGNGAVLGYAGRDGNGEQIYCSINHELKYPCYCPKEFRTCKETGDGYPENMIPAPDAKTCTFDNVTYYSSCVPANCKVENESLGHVEINDLFQEMMYDLNGLKDKLKEEFGQPSVYMCSLTEEGKENQVAMEVSCNTTEYNSTCEYPYTTPRNSKDYCKYSDVPGNTIKSSSAVPHYKAAACRIKSDLSVCGENITTKDGDLQTAEEAGVIIKVATTENECYEKYGAGVTAQLCEDNNFNRAYNCFFKSDDFPYTTSNCGVRHDLSGKYVIKDGVKHWSTCKCVAAYQHHKYNCAGYLSGSPCKQTITSDLIESDNTLKEAEEDLQDANRTLLGAELPYYPYCKCSSDFNKVCDEDSSGRYKGVGDVCNGKYKECQCVPDELPLNWTDNYYGCPGGKRPTGVWKDNGCGQKYYQCSIQECTWEYTEKCESPQEPIGEPCQDNTGKIGGYKECRCPTNYRVCPAGQVGVGEPCNLKGVSYYKDCKIQDSCAVGADKTCTGPLQIGVNPCTKNNETLYEKCICAQGYNKVCTDGKVGVGASCELDGTTYYKECADPKETKCTPNHVKACTVYQERYSPCIDTDKYGAQTIKYLCRCPSNWTVCSEEGGEGEGKWCRDTSGVQYWEKCYTSEIGDSNNAGTPCNEYQNANYKICSSAQKGYGGNCISADENGTEVRKYAKCEDSTDCAISGFKYSCSGYNPDIQGDYCVDINGNKMYKSCACPTSYVACTNNNATKGNKCSPLKVDGTFADPVYSSCSCDRGRFRYTCQADEESGNIGIKAPVSSDAKYCIVTELVKQSTSSDSDEESEDEEPIPSDKEVEADVKYYTYCECQEDYKYTCLNYDAGYVNPKENTSSADNKDYCLLNTTRFYKGCDCQADYKYATDEDCPEGQKVDVTSAACTPIGSFAAAGDGGHEPGITYYKKCTIDKSSEDIPVDEGDSEDEETEPDSGSVSCNSDYKYVCSAITGTTGGSGTPCDGKYTACTCEERKKWNATTGKCECSTDYKYICSTGTTGGSGNSCDGLYAACTCEERKRWNATTGKCECSTDYKYSCNVGSGITGGAGATCDSKYTACTCEERKRWNATTGKCECSTDYKYSCSISFGTTGGVGEACDGQYAQCSCSTGFSWISDKGVCAASSCAIVGTDYQPEKGICASEDGESIWLINGATAEEVTCYPASCIDSGSYDGGGNSGSNDGDDDDDDGCGPNAYACTCEDGSPGCCCSYRSYNEDTDFLNLFNSKATKTLRASITHIDSETVMKKYVSNLRTAQDETDCEIYI